MFLFLLVLALSPAKGEDLRQEQEKEMLSCALHGGGGWLDSELYADGKLRFTYALKPSENSESQDLYVAFWNSKQTKGDLLVFSLSKGPDRNDLLILNNQGHLSENNGQLEVRDTLWGTYTYRKIKALLPELRRQSPSIMPVDQVPVSTSVCKTPVDFRRRH
jgi:hypothetical protein